MPAEPEGRWLKRFAPAPADPSTRLVCLHHAGGAASGFRDLARRVGGNGVVDVVAVQLPGREERIAEPAFDRMSPLVDRLVEVVAPLFDRPVVLLGHSMGAQVAFALARRLVGTGVPPPCALVAVASLVPGQDLPFRSDTDADVLDFVRRLGGTPQEVLDHAELLELLLPTVRADLTVLATAASRNEPPLSVPIVAVAGTCDLHASPEVMASWAGRTTDAFTLHVIDGAGHFLLGSHLARVAEILDGVLTPGR